MERIRREDAEAGKRKYRKKYQCTPLKNFIKEGKVEISNNLVEQRMKTIKPDMKNCQNIGSQEAAKRLPSCTPSSRVAG